MIDIDCLIFLIFNLIESTLVQDEQRDEHRPDGEGVVEERGLAGRDALDGEEVEERRDAAEPAARGEEPLAVRSERAGARDEDADDGGDADREPDERDLAAVHAA